MAWIRIRIKIKWILSTEALSETLNNYIFSFT